MTALQAAMMEALLYLLGRAAQKDPAHSHTDCQCKACDLIELINRESK